MESDGTSFYEILNSTSALLQGMQAELVQQKLILFALRQNLTTEQLKSSQQQLQQYFEVPQDHEHIADRLQQSLQSAVDFFAVPAAQPTPEELRKMFQVISGRKVDSSEIPHG